MTAEQLKHVRRLIGIRQIQLANATGMQQTRLSLLETGNAQPTPEEDKKIRSVLLNEIRKQQLQLAKLLPLFAA